jgi:predicted MFS family arabinose efflux permease
VTGRPSAPAARRQWPQTLAAFSVPYFPRLLFCGVLWNTSRWMHVFLIVFLAAELTESPLLLQLVGASLFAPFLVGGVVGGVVSDRFDRRLLGIAYFGILIPISAGAAVLVLADAVHIWMLCPFGLIAGASWVVDLTTRRALVADIVGPELVTNAFSLEALSSSLGGVVGALAGGAAISLIGIGEAYVVNLVLVIATVAMLITVKSPARKHVLRVPWREDLRSGLALLPRHPSLVSILGVTMVMNLFFFSHISLIPEIAEDLHVSAVATGLLSAASTIGAMAGALVIASLPNPRRGPIYVGGALFALACLPVFALSDSYPLALAGLIVGGCGLGGFAAMQFTLVTAVAGPAAHGRALGLMTTVIGVAPFGSLLLGLVAEPIGARPAIVGSALVGCLLIVLWMLRWPDSIRLR